MIKTVFKLFIESQTIQYVFGQSSFYISTPIPSTVSAHSSIATTVSKSTSEDIQTWHDIDLPRVYRPLSTPINMTPEKAYRFGAEGTIMFIPEHLDVHSNQKKVEIAGVHAANGNRKPNIWQKTKERLLGNRRHIKIQSFLKQQKSEDSEIKDETVATVEITRSSRYINGVLESDL